VTVHRAASLAWMAQGTDIFRAALARRADLGAPTALAGWTGKHVAAHVAANAEALLNLVRWARTGEPSPMYASAGQRDADIEEGATQPTGVLRDRVASSAAQLARGLAELTGEQWSRTVRTAQGRLVPAAEVPWMRSREVFVHAVDLGAGVTFADLPGDFLVALIGDVVAKRSGAGAGPALAVSTADGAHAWSVTGSGPPVDVRGSLADVAAYLTGRPPVRVNPGGAAAPELPPWL
jgi:maleylpyruvate isomerase